MVTSTFRTKHGKKSAKLYTQTGMGIQSHSRRLLYHPDKQHRDTRSEQDTESARRFIEISRAWKILGNEETRRAYDLQRREVKMTQSFPVDTQIHLEEMIWHEDEDHYAYSCRCGGQYIAGESDLQQTSLVSCDSCSLIVEILQGSQS
ncbi:dnaJ homolog subfamily C member 24 isoform X3 [Dendropsophus ebraccatus]|uniref:dnaJ homolog subfamily C member 24 isoform X3 n=1 Tax=Dendropsophus ebraccatus TaxID=150705 RepID=UPI0038312C83